MQALIVILVVALVVVGAIFSHLAEKKRREEMATLAKRLGLRFDPGSDHSHDEEFAQRGVGGTSCIFRTCDLNASPAEPLHHSHAIAQKPGWRRSLRLQNAPQP